MVVLKTEKLTKLYGKKAAVNSVNMTINKGDIYGLVGTNGAGKTTLMRLVLSLASPSEGSIELLEDSDIIAQCHRVGSLIETPSIYRGCTAYENLRRYSVLYGADESKIDEILTLVGLDGTGRKKAGHFSLGMTQRLGIGIALLGDPEFLILDEPVNGLDPLGISEIRNLILKLNREKGITFLISSHLLDELAKIATKVGIVNKGSLIREMTIEEMQNQCKKKLYIQTDNNAKAIELLNDKYSVFEENASIVIDDCDSPAMVNKLLVDEGVGVSMLLVKGSSLEEYYMEMVGGAHE